ncbi:WYL domain-containing protein [Acinetobacter qingfengensis]|uniref:DNA translocase FtsK n=1 Tax=Acinetobacter qingfengensis TaxID=1262585 RepID=A0A1E7RF94_9GAMM|nr:FtsK/SpoIIIE domain-containing protein [Acinetobacter qingfengensis]KAA8732820.1 WYL domain-containing protein [Acinetobacter qingfengensis]OEY98070.1 hypothetical protein BJI46_00650 [Acinetobacter qingfengensis]
MSEIVPSQIKRILRIYQILPRQSSKAYSIEQLKTYLRSLYSDVIDEKSINKAIRRDLKTLNVILTSGTLEKIILKGNQPDKYYLSQDASIEPLSAEKALVLVMANEYLQHYLPHEIYHKVSDFFESAEQQLVKNTKLQDWRSRIRFVSVGYSPEYIDDFDCDEIKKIYKALLDSELWLECLYCKEGQTEKQAYTLKPHGIIQHGHKQFLMASKIMGHRSVLRTFNLQRFDQVKLIEQRISVDIDAFDLDNLIEEKEYEYAYFERDELEIKLRCENDLLDDLQNNPIHFSQEITEFDDDYFTLTASSIITNSLLNWLIEKAHSIQVLEPQELFEKVQRYIYDAIENYDMDFEDLEQYKQSYKGFDGAVDTLEDFLQEDHFDENINADISASTHILHMDKCEQSYNIPNLDLLDKIDPQRKQLGLIQILEAENYSNSNVLITLALGKNTKGEIITTDLNKAPHLLIAGSINSNQSSLIHSMILSILLKYTPDQIRLILIDCKQSELANYQDIPHLLTPVVTNEKDTLNVLNWCIHEMERRYTLFSSINVRTLKNYNTKIKETNVQNIELDLPQIVVVVNELADVMQKDSKKIEKMISYLAQKSRAAGIHLVLATQNLSKNIITERIKANIPSRIALKVDHHIQSCLILDHDGAENLSAQGDMLFLGPGKVEPEYVSGAFVSTDEINRICDVWRQCAKPQYIKALLESYRLNPFDISSYDDGYDIDADLLYQCTLFVLKTRKVSVSSLQHQFGLGYTQAARIIDQMEDDEIVSPMDADGKREILV